MPQNLGIYIHVPFCENGKCPYCDFYSVIPDSNMLSLYVGEVKKRIAFWSEKAAGRTVDTIYFGGGTPSLLKTALADILYSVKSAFSVTDSAEITFEANPSLDRKILKPLKAAGFNRISLGMQSANPRELELLGRRHTPADVESAVKEAKNAGFDNVSLDLMLCTPEQTRESLLSSIEFAASLKPKHISAYLLKIEPGTKFYRIKDTLALQDEDDTAESYLFACEELEKRGFEQYEISNFAAPGFESRHNLKYWNCDEYIGIGPAAHSFFDGRRFYCGRSLKEFLNGDKETADGDGGSLEEYCMLRLRLASGLIERDMQNRYRCGFEKLNRSNLVLYRQNGLIEHSPERIRLTKKGFLLSNAVISGLLY